MDFNKIMNRLKYAYQETGKLNVAKERGLRHEQSYNDGLNYNNPVEVSNTGARIPHTYGDGLFGKTFAPNRETPLAENKDSILNSYNSNQGDMFNKGAQDRSRVSNIMNNLFGK